MLTQQLPENWRAWPVEAKLKMLERLRAMPSPQADPLTPVQQTEWNSCQHDAAYFIDTHVIIDEPQGADMATIPFHLWDAQIDALGHLVADKLVIILKARQLGISWLCCAYVLWLCLFHPGRVVLLLSKGELEANELARRIKAMYGRLPDWMRERVTLPRDNSSELGWANESRVQSLAATRSAGRSFTASLVLMDEFAFMQWGADVYTAVKPTIDAGGQLFIVSTANGEGDKFHALWNDALRKINNFAAIFLSWRARPGRDDQWRAARAAEALSPMADLQEYPNAPEDAFQSTGQERFLPSILQWEACKETLSSLTRHEPMVLGVDAGASNDYFAVVGVTRHPANKNNLAVRYVRVWKPLPGQPLNFNAIESELRTVLLTQRDLYNIERVVFDPALIHQMMQSLRSVAYCKEFPQGTARLAADKNLLDLILARRIAHDGDPELRAAIDNADRKVDAEERKLRIVKRRDQQKIDAAVALSMAAYEHLTLLI